MLSKVRVLIWEQRRNTLKGLFFIAGTIAVYAFLLYTMNDLILRVLARSKTLAMGVAFVPLLGAAVLLFLNEDRRVIGFDYPLRMLVLPIRTRFLVTTQLVYKLVMMVALAWEAGFVARTFIYDKFCIWPQILLAVILLTALQALVFLVRAFGTATGLTIFFVVALALSPLFHGVAGAVLANFEVRNEFAEFELPWRNPTLAAGACTVLWWLAAFMGARHARREVPEDRVGAWVNLLSSIAHFERPRDEFASAQAAQRWLEWRRGPYLFPWLALGAGVVLLAALQTRVPGMHQRFQTLLVLLGLAPAAVACLLGHTLTRNDARYTWFVGPRPITTAAIGRARFVASIKGMLWAYGLLLVTLVVVYQVFFPGHPLHASVVEDLRETTNTSGPYLEGVMMLAFYLAVVVLGVWSLFWLGRAAGVAVWIAGLVGGFHFWRTGQLYVISGGAEDSSPILMAFVYALTGLALAGLLLSYAVACKRGHVSPRSLAALVVAAVVLGAGAFAFHSFLPTSRTWLAALWLVVPVIPFAALPLTIDWQRHG